MVEVQAPALMTQAEYARHRDCSRQYVSRLAREGRLVTRDDLIDVIESDKLLGPPGETDEDEVLSGTDRSRAELRLIEAQAALAEMKLKERGGELIERIEAQRQAADLSMALREKLVAMPRRIADRLIHIKTERELAIAISDAIEDALADFAAELDRAYAAPAGTDVQEIPGERGLDDSARNSAGAAPAAADHAERMGGDVPGYPAGTE